MNKAIAVLGMTLAIGMATATLSPAHADWHDGQWGHWGWHGGARVFIVDPYPYAPYGYPYAYVSPPPPPPPVYAAPAPVVIGPSFSVRIH